MVEFYILCVVLHSKFNASLLSVTFEFHNLACDLEARTIVHPILSVINLYVSLVFRRVLFPVSVLPDGGNLREGERCNNGDNGSSGLGVAEQSRLEDIEVARSKEQKRHVPEDRGSAGIVSEFLVIIS